MHCALSVWYCCLKGYTSIISYLLTNPLRQYHYPYFTNRETEVQKGKVACLRSHSLQEEEQDLNP